MNIKIAGQSSKSNYHNTGSCRGAVNYSEHELRELPKLFEKIKVQPDDLRWFDMNGNEVSGTMIMNEVGRLSAHLGKNDAKFYCIMINPSDDEALAMGANLEEQINNGQCFVYEVMDAYAKNFLREKIKNRHDLVAFAIPHIYKKGGKLQIHWHVIVARLSRGIKEENQDGKMVTRHFKLSPMTNHRNTKTGAVKGGFDRVKFDEECERRFDLRFNYERRVENSFKYLLAVKKGTEEEKAIQEARLVQQNYPTLEESIKTALARRAKRLEMEKKEVNNIIIKEQSPKEENAKKVGVANKKDQQLHLRAHDAEVVKATIDDKAIHRTPSIETNTIEVEQTKPAVPQKPEASVINKAPAQIMPPTAQVTLVPELTCHQIDKKEPMPQREQQVSPIPSPVAEKPTYEEVKSFECNYQKYRIIKTTAGIFKLQQLNWDTRSIVDGKYTRKCWKTQEKFISVELVGRDNDGMYFKITDTRGKNRYINQNGYDLAPKKLRQLGIGGLNNGGMKIG